MSFLVKLKIYSAFLVCKTEGLFVVVIHEVLFMW